MGKDDIDTPDITTIWEATKVINGKKAEITLYKQKYDADSSLMRHLVHKGAVTSMELGGLLAELGVEETAHIYKKYVLGNKILPDDDDIEAPLTRFKVNTAVVYILGSQDFADGVYVIDHDVIELSSLDLNLLRTSLQASKPLPEDIASYCNDADEFVSHPYVKALFGNNAQAVLSFFYPKLGKRCQFTIKTPTLRSFADVKKRNESYWDSFRRYKAPDWQPSWTEAALAKMGVVGLADVNLVFPIDEQGCLIGDMYLDLEKRIHDGQEKYSCEQFLFLLRYPQPEVKLNRSLKRCSKLPKEIFRKFMESFGCNYLEDMFNETQFPKIVDSLYHENRRETHTYTKNNDIVGVFSYKPIGKTAFCTFIGISEEYRSNSAPEKRKVGLEFLQATSIFLANKGFVCLGGKVKEGSPQERLYQQLGFQRKGAESISDLYEQRWYSCELERFQEIIKKG